MAGVFTYVQDGTAATFSLLRPSRRIQAFKITGLTPGLGMVTEARTFFTLGAVHPYDSSIVLIDANIRIIDSDKVEGEEIWDAPTDTTGEPSPTAEAMIELGTSLQTVKTSRDVHGVIIRIPAWERVLYDNTNMVSIGTERILEQIAEVEGEIALDLLLFRRLETGLPLSKKKQYQRRMNSAPIWQYKAGQLLCAEINASSVGSGNYSVSYNFVGRPEGWLVDVVAREPDGTDRPADGAAVNAGIKTGVEMNLYVDFGELNLGDF